MEKIVLIIGIISILPSVFAVDFNVTKREKFPYQASIRRDGIHLCGGTIYSKRHVLTAASCVNNTKATDWQVITGTLNLEKVNGNESQIIMVEKMWVHKDYSGKNVQNNIAVLYLSSNLQFNNYTQSIPIARKWVAKDAQKCVVSGWGANGTHFYRQTDLHHANVTIATKEMDCKRTYPPFLQNVMMCAGDDYLVNPCTGDLGGPLVCNNSLYGVVTWRSKCETRYEPGMYTNITYFADWITKTTKTNSATSMTSAVMFTVCAALFSILKN